MLQIRKIMSLFMAICIFASLSGCGKEEKAVLPQDENLFFGGISVEMDLRDAEKATKNSQWFQGKLDNYERSVRRAKVDSAEFIYSPLPLTGGKNIIPRITFDKKGEVIFIGAVIPVGKDKNDYERALESYEKDFIRRYSLGKLDSVQAEKTSVKQIGEKSVFRKATKLFYDPSVRTCRYSFDKKEKIGYAVYEMEDESEGYSIAFLQFKY